MIITARALLFGFFLLFFACSGQYMQGVRSHNKIGNDNYSYYTNDSLKIRIQFFGDYVPFNLNDSSYKNHVLTLSGILNLSKKHIQKHILQSLKTNIEPWLQTALVVSDNEFIASHNWKNLNISNREFRETNLKCENYDVRIVDLKYKINKKPLLWITWLNNEENKTNILSEETESILSTIKFGKNYSNFIPPNPFTEADNAFESDFENGGNYLSPLARLKSIEKNYGITPNSFFSQALNTYQSFVGVETKNIFPSSEKTIESLKTIPFLKNNDAKDALIKNIAKNQVVMFNEAHVYPRQRYLISSLLDTLYKLNFRVLALEALFKEPTGDKIFPNLQSGFYVREPQMANLIRHAQSLGFRIVSYEDTLENSKGREIMEAENLFNSTLKKSPKEKIIVLAGVQHIEENPMPNNKRWMASYFKEMSGVDPLSINQTALDNLTFSNDELIFFDGSDILNLLGATYANDIYLINHIKSENFKINPNARDFKLKINLKFDSAKRIENTLVVLVYNASEFTMLYKIPVYLALTNNTEKYLELKMPQGAYYVVVKNSIGQTLFKEKFVCKVGNVRD